MVIPDDTQLDMLSPSTNYSGASSLRNKLVSPFVTRRSRRGIAEEESAMSFRGFLYGWARLLGDVNAVQKGHVGQRVGRRIVGKITGRLLGRLFK